MISLKSEFRFVNRGFKDTLVLVPGWATDYRVFGSLGLRYNYLLAVKLNLYTFAKDLAEAAGSNSTGKISLLGYSLGGFLVCDFAGEFSEITGEVFLISVRRRYELKALEAITLQLKKNKRAWLYKFYHNCFSKSSPEGISWFKENLMKRYLEEISLDQLIYGLDYLASSELNPECLSRVKKITILHGLEDKIAPLKEAQEIKSYLPQAELLVLSGCGHMLFLEQAFGEKFYG